MIKRYSILFLLFILFVQLLSKENTTDIISSGTISTFDTIVGKAKLNNWRDIPIGELTAKVGLEFLGTPYKDRTLEGEPEMCKINFDGMDCVTFFENSLDLARIIRKDKLEFGNLIDETIKTRYRNQHISDYTSRLHYTSDWIYENKKNFIVNDITRALGGRKVKFNCNFMSQNPQYYDALKSHPELIDIIKAYEDSINTREYYVVSKQDISRIEKFLESGDIIAIATSKKGLDYSHTGMIYKDTLGKPRFLHASTRAKMVIIDTTISAYINKIQSDIGITVLRPNEPN